MNYLSFCSDFFNLNFGRFYFWIRIPNADPDLGANRLRIQCDLFFVHLLVFFTGTGTSAGNFNGVFPEYKFLTKIIFFSVAVSAVRESETASQHSQAKPT
jgi:hypothetical protein